MFPATNGNKWGNGSTAPTAGTRQPLAFVAHRIAADGIACTTAPSTAGNRSIDGIPAGTLLEVSGTPYCTNRSHNAPSFSRCLAGMNPSFPKYHSKTTEFVSHKRTLNWERAGYPGAFQVKFALAPHPVVCRPAKVSSNLSTEGKRSAGSLARQRVIVVAKTGAWISSNPGGSWLWMA